MTMETSASSTSQKRKIDAVEGSIGSPSHACKKGHVMDGAPEVSISSPTHANKKENAMDVSPITALINGSHFGEGTGNYCLIVCLLFF